VKALLKKNIVLLLSGQLVSELGSVMQSFALSLYVFTRTHSEIAFSSVLAVAILPRLFGPFTGVITDRINRKRMLVVLDIAAGGVTMGFAAWHQFVMPLPLSCIYIFVILLSAIQTFYTPTVTAIIPELVGPDLLKQTNVASTIVSTAALILGPVIAPLLGPGTDEGILVIMLINFVSFLAAALVESFFRNQSAVDIEKTANESVAQSLREGLKTVYKSKELMMIVLLSICANFALYPIFSVGVSIIMYKDLGVSDELFGVSKSIQYIGPILGSILAGIVLKRTDYRRLLVRLLLLDSALLAVMAAVLLTGRYFNDPLVWQFAGINLTALFVVATIVLADISITTALQRIVPGHLMGRVSGVDSSLSMIAIPLGQMLFGMLSSRLNSMVALLCFAVFTVIAGIAAHFLYRPMLAPGAVAQDMPEAM
jgi:MFS family permease